MQRGRGDGKAAAAEAHDKAVALARELAAEAAGGPDAPPSFPEGLTANVRDVGGEISASVEETNRLRAALGLKPLQERPSGPPGGPGHTADRAQLAQLAKARADAAEAAALASRVAAAREQRRQEALLRGTTGLGEASEADDAWAWVQRSRTLAQEQARRTEAALAAQDAVEEEEEEEEGAGARAAAYSSRDLAGLRVDGAVGAAGALGEGEEMVLTLKDSRLIGAGGGELADGDDELEEVRLTELQARDKARRASKKKTRGPFEDDEEEGSVPLPFLAGAAAPSQSDKKLLTNYDEQQAPTPMTLDATGTVGDEAKAARLAAVRSKLAQAGGAGAARPQAQSAETAVRMQTDTLTAEEVAEAAAAAAAAAGKKLRKKAKRPKATRTLKADDLIPLDDEETAAAAAASAAAAAAAARAGGVGSGPALDAAWGRFEAAKARAAAVSAARIGTLAAPVGEEAEAPEAALEEEGADQELAAALDRARRAAAARAGPAAGDSTASLAAAVGARRAAAEGGPAGGGAGGAWMTDTQEFVRTLNVERAKARAEEAAVTGIVLPGQPGAAAHSAPGEESAQPPPAVATSQRRPYRARADAAEAAEAAEAAGTDWAAAAGAEAGAAGGEEGAAEEAPRPVDVLGSGRLGGAGASRGLAATLSLLKEKGSLTEGVKWAGRNTDKKAQAVKVAVEAAAVETAKESGYQFDFKLDRFDEFGRKMTPKEAFRELCHKFHGIFPSRSKQEARLKQWHEEQAALKARDGDTPLDAAAKMRDTQQRTATPFVVLSGRVKSSQVTDANSRYAMAEPEADAARAGAASARPAPMLGSSMAPMGAAQPGLGGGALPSVEGAAKVRFSLAPVGGAKRTAPGGTTSEAPAKKPRT